MFFLKVTLCHTSKLLSSQVQDWFTVTISKTRIFQTHFSSFGEEARSETTPDSAVTTFKWSFTRSLTHSSLKGFPLEFIFLVKRWVVVLIKLLQYWIQVLDSLLSIWKPNVDSISWLNWRARERERVLSTVFYLCFFPPSRCSSILDFALHRICEKTFVLGICEKITEATPQGIDCCQLPWVLIPQLYLIHQLGIYTSIAVDWNFSSLITVVSLLQSFASSSLSCSCCILKIDRQHDNDCHNNIPALLQKTETEIIISCSMSSSCKILAHEKKDQYTTIQALLQKTHSDNHQLQNPSMRRRIGTTS